MNCDKNETKTFWDTKPVLKTGKFTFKSSPIDNLENRALYNTNVPTKLPDTMEWKIIDRKQMTDMECVCDFLNRYYSLETPKIHFTIDLLNWILSEDGILLTIINKNSLAIVGMVGCNFETMTVFDKTERFAHAQFLCTHTSYRKKNMAKLLITELGRYVFMNCKVSQGIFESENKLFQPISSVRSYARPLNYSKLHQTQFLTTNEKNIDTLHKNFLATEQETTNYHAMEEKDLDAVYKLYNLYMSKFNVSRKYTKQELLNVLLNNKIVTSYVIIKDNNIVDFVSYCTIQYKTINVPVNVAHLFLYTLNTEYGESMIDYVLTIMAKNNIDVMITSDTMAINNIILSEKHDIDDYESDTESYSRVYEHKFMKQGKKYINLFNWQSPYVSADRLSFFSL